MKKLDFFLAALKAEAHLRTAWVISIFSLVSEAPDAWRPKGSGNDDSNNYPYRVVQTPAGHFFVNPDNRDELIVIEDANAGMPIFEMKDEVDVLAGSLPNMSQDTHTTYGNLLFNAMCLVYPFGAKIPYQNGDISSSKIEEMIVERLKGTYDKEAAAWEGEGRNPKWIYVDEHLKFVNAMFSLSAYTQLCVPACSEKSMTAPPGIKELRDALLLKYKDRLHDPEIIALIDAELVAHLKEYMKGDPAMGFLSKKSFDVVRKKLFLMNGAEASLEKDNSFQLVTRSLNEGWDMNDFAALCTGSRSGSYNRGAQTELGGEAVKWLFRASSNLAVTMKDCGSRMGNYMFAAPGEEHKLLGFTALIGNDNVKIDKTNVGSYMGQRILVRSPMYCKAEKTDFCEACIGDRLANSPTGLSTAVAHYGDTFMALFMKAMHSNVLELEKLDTATAII